MFTEMKMVPTLGDRVERMRMSTLPLLTCYKTMGSCLPWFCSCYTWLFDFSLCMQFSFIAGIVVVKSNVYMYIMDIVIVMLENHNPTERVALKVETEY